MTPLTYIPDGRNGAGREGRAGSGGGGEHGRGRAVVGPREARLQRPADMRRLQRRLLEGVAQDEDVVGANAQDNEDTVVHKVRGVLLLEDHVPHEEPQRVGDDDLEQAAGRDEQARGLHPETDEHEEEGQSDHCGGC